MFTIEMLPAREGDALWIEYGNPKNPNRILIDCGYKSTYRLIMDRIDKNPDITFELLVLTHIDGDHIAGAVPFIADKRVTTDHISEIWFNGREMIDDTLGARQAEYFTKYIEDKGFSWNSQYGNRAIYLQDVEHVDPVKLPGGLIITLLSPGGEQLDDLLNKWNKDLDSLLKEQTLDEMLEETPTALQPDVLGEPDIEQLARGTFEPDSTAPNGSSIAFLAEYTDIYDDNRVKRIIFSGDAHSHVLESSIKKVLEQTGAETLNIDALKVSHHGSKSNTSMELLKLINCQKYLFSTNGSRHSHPDVETIARVIKSNRKPVKLYFNYLSTTNKIWKKPKYINKYKYEAYYPSEDNPGLVVPI
ncbi:MAG: MBL fold metallo-hydrolase [Gammaproteobacteria bacterium]|nr:MBL fold metallo-hydrolase [Gammaproteobacteria bacterium]